MEDLNKIIDKKRNIVLRGADPLTKRGFAQVPVIILQNKNISDTAKLVYAMMLYYAWYKDYCFPGQEKLAKDIGKDSRSIRRAIKNLRDNNFLEVKRRGLTKTNIYYLYIKSKNHP